MPSNREHDVEAAIASLCSLHDGDHGVLAVIACGRGAIPRLKDVLVRSEPSGLFETRCRAVRALKALSGGEELASFLSTVRLAKDPVQRLGDEAVVEAAARALSEARHDDASFGLLLRLGRDLPYLAGVVEALAHFERAEAVPVFVQALGDDAARPAAEAGLLRLGRLALPLLIVTATEPWPDAENESDGSRRKRRSALGLISQIGCPAEAWPRLRSLMEDKDARISAFGCKLGLMNGSAAERKAAAGHLAELLAGADWLLRSDIHDTLAQCGNMADHRVRRGSRNRDPARDQTSLEGK